MTGPSPSPRSDRRAERTAAAGFGVCTLAAVALAVVYWRGGQPQLEGIFLAVAFGGLAFGFVMWAKTLLPQGPFVEERHETGTSAVDREAFEEDLERGGIERRTFLTRSLGVAAGALGLAALFPIRSLGPSPGHALERTPWRKGQRLVTEDGTPVHTSDVPVGGLVTVFPEVSPGSADGQAVLIRVQPGLISAAPGRETWSPRGFIAYSKICTHAGCPVGLFSAESNQLLCPCHQSTFDVLEAAKPVFGPAAAALPQLPLTIDATGFLVAGGDFSEPVGPSFWSRR
ncbi:MAG: ubiquinol-cytochrome c reductase iron-sulfur subunit [Acidimicrobiaceae bacterium]|jgi:ubiquinol-cytochrome c reductase iron-sulfur subunit|nr:ubiquinol-cytochrome c reductase iron-sulfur subunit [Acidimicrobiaceae bacterium]